jgi:hypothetical protein
MSGTAPVARALALAVGAVTTAALLFLYATSPNITISGQEQNVVFTLQTMLRGAPLYRDPSRLPFVVTQYTPLYDELCVLLCRWFGVHADDLRAIYLVGRVLSAAATLGSCAGIAAILARSLQLDRIAAAALGLALPALIGAWACATRGDALYLLCVVASLWAALEFAASRRPALLAAAALLLVVAYYAKQTALFLFPLPFVVLFARRGWRALRPPDLLIAAAVYAAGAAFLTPAMLGNFAVGLGNGIDLRAALRETWLPVFLWRLPLVLAAALALAAQRDDWRARAVALATLWFLLIGLVLSLKYGSSENYLDEFLLGCLLLAGVALARPVCTPALLLGLVVMAEAGALYYHAGTLRSALAPRHALYAAGRTLASDPALRGQRIMALDTAVLPFVPDRAVFVPLEVLGSSAASGHYDLTPVIAAVRAGQICFAVVDPALLRAIGARPAAGDDANPWMAVVGPQLLAGFQVVRQIGPFTLMRAACGR